MKNKRLLWAIGAFLVFFVFPAFFAWNFVIGPALEANAKYKALVGKPETDVITALGQPKYRETAAEVKKNGVDFPWRKSGFLPLPERPATKEVLLYFASDATAGEKAVAVYIFIGNDDRVEGIDFAGTG